MLKVYLILILFFWSVTDSFSQYKIWFNDDFNDTTKNWYGHNYESPVLSRKIKNGKFHLHQKDSLPNTYWSIVSIYTHPDKPLLIEANILQTESSGINGFGLFIKGKGDKHFYFLIDPTHKIFWVGSEQKSVWKTYNAYTEPYIWSQSAFINGLNISNNLKVHVHEGKVEFLVNDNIVFSSASNPDFAEMFGSTWQGISTSTTMKIEVENYTVYQDNPPVNVIPDLPRLTKTNLGTNVNSKYIEKSPYISPDGKTLYFVVQGDPENMGQEKVDEIFFSTALTDSTWGKRQNMGWPLNNDGPNAVISATPDNNTLYTAHTYNLDGTHKGGGFSITAKTEGGWSVPKDLKVQNFYNKSIYNEFCFSADRKVLLMSVRRNETFGENDIYVSFLQESGEFSEPKNLGNIVNTFAWESSPFLAPDGVSLYYSTAGYPGYGEADIFMTRRLDSTWTNWSTPLNMGPDINSSGWEAYYCLAASGKYAYVLSTLGGVNGSLDIYQVKLPDVLKPKPVVLVYGKVLNSKTNEPLESDINYNILASNKEMGIATSGSNDGSYKIVLPAGEVYSFLSKKSGYYSVSENIDLSAITKYKELERNLYLVPLQVGGNIRLNNLFFDLNKSSLRKESFPELNRLIKLLNDNSTMEIEIAGHTDNTGTDEINNNLSQERALSVKTYLVNNGIALERISSKGYGKTKPVEDNISDSGRQKNRRVEFVILKK